jgi:ABC-type spermidine/putrescine transport system permease subunit II
MTTQTIPLTKERSARSNRFRALWTQENVATIVVSIIVGAAVILPLGVLFVSSFLVLDPLGWDTTWGFDNYVTLFTDRVIPKAFLNTILVSSGCTVLATLLGVSLAWVNARTNCPFRDYLEPFNLIPFFLSPFVGAIAWYNLASPQSGLLNALARDNLGVESHIFNVSNLWGVIWVTGIFFAPLVYLFVVGSLRRMDPSLEDSARTTGAGLWRTTMTVTLPLVMPGILSGAIIVFVTSAGEFGVPFKLSAPNGWQTLTTQIFSKAVGDDANHYLGATMAMSLGLITVFLIWIQQRYIAPRSFTTVTGKGFRPNVLDLGKWRWVAFGYNVTYIMVAVVLPIASLIIVSLHPVWTGEILPADMSFENYRKTLFFWHDDSIDAATNGIINSLIAPARLPVRCTDRLPRHRAGDGCSGDLHPDADLRDAVYPVARLHHALLSLWPAEHFVDHAGDLRRARPEFTNGRRVLVHDPAAHHHPAIETRHIRRLDSAVRHLPARIVDVDYPLYDGHRDAFGRGLLSIQLRKRTADRGARHGADGTVASRPLHIPARRRARSTDRLAQTGLLQNG